MPSAQPILIPLLNPNEPEVSLAALNIREGQPVDEGDILCTLETTKSTAELAAESSGYIVGLKVSPGQILRAGDLLCYISDTPDWTPPGPTMEAGTLSDELPVGLRITQPALAWARTRGIDLTQLPKGPLVTEQSIQGLLTGGTERNYLPPISPYDPTTIIIYGGGGHGKTLIELVQALGIYHIVGIIDDGLPVGESILNTQVIGGKESLSELYARGIRLAVNAVGGIGNLGVRIHVFEILAQNGFTCPALIHPRACVEPSADLSAGVNVFPLAYIGSASRIHYGAIINTGAIVSHDCVIGNYANLSPGAILAGSVEIGDGVLVGMGATINLHVKIGHGARIGNGATVKADVPESGVVRAGTIWPG
jgi:sugar O-acyltransferase (sialic acid O-acetyltransferase NeuD family)